jgi:hypothetical protein
MCAASNGQLVMALSHCHTHIGSHTHTLQIAEQPESSPGLERQLQSLSDLAVRACCQLRLARLAKNNCSAGSNGQYDFASLSMAHTVHVCYMTHNTIQYMMSLTHSGSQLQVPLLWLHAEVFLQVKPPSCLHPCYLCCLLHSGSFAIRYPISCWPCSSSSCSTGGPIICWPNRAELQQHQQRVQQL